MFRILSLIFCLCLASQSLAYGAGGGGYDNPNSGKLSNAVTNKVARTLTRGVQGCLRLENVYRYDCYRTVYGLAARQLANNSAYEEARKILATVEAELGKTVARNLDANAPRKRRGVQQFRAIKPNALPRAKRDFLRTLEQAETRLLRSSNSDDIHFVKIAQAINSNKVLLRSALLRLPVAPLAMPVVALMIPVVLQNHSPQPSVG